VRVNLPPKNIAVEAHRKITVTVIGAGVAGLTAATELTEQGLLVEVIDSGPSIGPHSCSWYAGAMLAPWCEGETAEEKVVRLGQESIDWWDQHVPGVVRKGSLVVTANRDNSELDRFSRRTAQHSWLDTDAINSLEPDLKEIFRRALFFPDEAHLNPRLALKALEEKLISRGVRIFYNMRMEDYNVASEFIVDARGIAAQDTLADLRGVKGEMLMLKTRDITLTRPVRLLHPRYPMYIVPHDNNIFMIGATQIETEERSRITARGMVDLLNAAYTVHPAFAEAEIIEVGCDVRPAFPDNQPRLRRLGRTFYINGLFRHGFLLAPAMARMTAEAILNPDFVPEVMDEYLCERASL